MNQSLRPSLFVIDARLHQHERRRSCWCNISFGGDYASSDQARQYHKNHTRMSASKERSYEYHWSFVWLHFLQSSVVWGFPRQAIAPCLSPAPLSETCYCGARAVANLTPCIHMGGFREKPTEGSSLVFEVYSQRWLILRCDWPPCVRGAELSETVDHCHFSEPAWKYLYVLCLSDIFLRLHVCLFISSEAK